MVRTGQPPVLVIGVAAILVAAVGTGVVITRDQTPVAKATTVLGVVRDARLVAPNGANQAARAGMRVPNGDLVRTGPSGSAELITRGRVVYVEHDATVAVFNGAHQQLRTGGAVIDALHGPGLRLDLAGDVLSMRNGSATEAIRSVSVSVGSLIGPADLTSATGRRLTVPALAQAVVVGDALPDATTPLHLSDSSAEAAAAPTLVNDDISLNGLARGIDSTGAGSAAVIQTAWTGTTTAMPAAAPSERVLPMVIADATTHAGGTTQTRYNHVVSWRQAGGSWGVVVALLHARAGIVEATFNTLQRHQPAGQIGTVSIQALAAAKVKPAQHTQTGTPGKTVGISTPTSPPITGSGGGHHGGSPAPKPKPTPTSDPVTKTVTTVKGVVGKVLGVVPIKVPKPKPVPTSVSGLLGGN